MLLPYYYIPVHQATVLFELDPIEPLANALLILCRLSEKCHFKWSPATFSIIVSQDRPPCISTFRMMPQLFTRFTCHHIHYVKFAVVDFFVIMSYLRRMGVSSLTFSMPYDQRNITLQYHIPCQENPTTKVLPTSRVHDHKNIGKIGYGSFFVSIALEEFRCVVKDLNNVGYAPIIITCSQIKFAVEIEHFEVTLTTEGGNCIIGGVKEGDEIECGFSLYPMEFYRGFTSKRVWLFKSYSPDGLMLIAPMGLYSHISSYFPNDYYD